MSSIDPQDKYKWPMPNAELAKVLGIKEGTLRQHQRNHKKELTKGEDYWGEDLGVPNAPTLMTVWSMPGAVKLAHFCRSRQAGVFLEEMNVTKRHICCPESSTLDVIEASIRGFTNCSRQFVVGSYKVDMYLKDLKIAIECDERGHADRDKWLESLRQEEIENRLGCRFMRYNPHATDFNVGIVINSIFKEIMSERSTSL